MVGKQRVGLKDQIHRPAIRRHAEHRLPVDQQIAFVRIVETRQHAQDRSFPRAARTKNGKKFAPADLETHPIHGRDRTVAAHDPAYIDRWKC